MPIPATRAVPTLSRSPSHNGIGAVRPAVLGLARLLGVSISAVAAAPLAATFEHGDGDDPDDLGTPLWVLYVASAILVLLGGAFAGLTIALMGQDSIYLQVISSDKDEPQHNNARRVYKLLESGKHWVLVTLLLSNVIVNESLPVVLDRCLGGGVAAVVGSTALIVIFGEVVPQSVCVRYGLQIGGYMSKPVLALMWLTAPLSWPTAKLLDWILGEDHGTVYKKSGLKTLVTLHRSLGVASERLNRDEVTIISAVLDLKEKPVAAVMTPMNDVFVMSEDTVLDEPTMDRILSAGYSRIPIHEAGNPTNFLGMLLVKILITYDPEDCMHVKDFPLATLPETRPETSCLDIVNYFQEGKSHMVLVSDSPGNPYGALGVVTLEDVIEELIGEEIIDESDVYVDVHKAIRRLHPAPNAQVYRRHSMTASKPADNTKAEENVNGLASPRPAPADVASTSKADASQLSASPRATFLLRRSSAGADGKMVQSAVPVRANIDDIREHLRHLGPSNPANNPKNTRLTSVTIKPGHGAVGSQRSALSEVTSGTPNIEVHQPTDGYEGGDDETTSLLRAAPANNRSVHRVSSKDGVQALRQSYGAVSATEAQQRVLGASPPGFTEAQRNQAAQTPKLTTTDEGKTTVNPKAPSSEGSGGGSPTSDDRGSRPNTPLLKRSTVRSGSITENIFESRGFRKVVLETASSNDGEDEDGSGAGLGGVGGGLNGGSISEPNLLGGRGSSSLSKSVSDVDEETDDEGARSAADRGTSPGGQSGASNNDGGKKKNRRKKRKGRS